MHLCWRKQAASFAMEAQASLCLSAKGGMHKT